MAARTRAVRFVVAGFLALAAAGGAMAAAPNFDTLLTEAGARFTPPREYVDVAAPRIESFPFNRAMRGPAGVIKALYAVRPIGRMEIEYNDPHSAAPNPNHIFPLVFETLVGMFSNGGHAPSRRFPDKAAKRRFNADWASATTFGVDAAVFPDYRYGFLLALHKNNKADIYSLFLYNDPALAKQRLDALLPSLVFRPGE